MNKIKQWLEIKTERGKVEVFATEEFIKKLSGLKYVKSQEGINGIRDEIKWGIEEAINERSLIVYEDKNFDSNKVKKIKLFFNGFGTPDPITAWHPKSEHISEPESPVKIEPPEERGGKIGWTNTWELVEYPVYDFVIMNGFFYLS